MVVVASAYFCCQTVVNTRAPNIAREIVIDLNLPRKITGVTVSRACLSGLQAILQAVHLIEHGDAHCVIAGGSDSTSNGMRVNVCEYVCVCMYV